MPRTGGEPLKQRDVGSPTAALAAGSSESSSIVVRRGRETRVGTLSRAASSSGVESLLLLAALANSLPNFAKPRLFFFLGPRFLSGFTSPLAVPFPFWGNLSLYLLLRTREVSPDFTMLTVHRWCFRTTSRVVTVTIGGTAAPAPATGVAAPAPAARGAAFTFAGSFLP